MNLKRLRFSDFRLPNFTGKVCGALLGFFLGGWMGMALGVMLGHSLDYHRPRLTRLLSRAHKRLTQARLPGAAHLSNIVRRTPDLAHRIPGIAHLESMKKRQRLFYRETLFLCLGHLAKQDGRVSPQEIAAAERLFKQLKLNSQERQQAIESFNRGKLDATQIEPRLRQLRQKYARRKKQRLELLDHCLQMAYAEGGPEGKQWQRLGDFVRLLAISSLEFEQLHQRLRSEHRQEDSREDAKQKHDEKQQHDEKPETYQEMTRMTAYRTLGLNAGASSQEIKLAYRRLMSQNHPDKLMAQGLTQRALNRAKNRTQDIQQAYALLKHDRSL